MNPLILPGIMLLLPLASALVILLFHGALKNIAHLLSTLVAITIFGCSLMLLGAKDALELPLFSFFSVKTATGAISANISFVIDQQSKGMMFIVTFVGMLVHIFSLGYMKDDDAKARYFGALSLFMFSMSGIVLADNLLMMFIFWELVGLSSYLLIGHWFKKASACEAAKKAFITNRIGDFGFMAGILILFGVCQSVRFADIAAKIPFLIEHAPALLTVAALGIFLGAMGKSAQVPLHVWLPDAMEGPTPVSALIHAATMVAAGVYMLARTHFLFIEGGTAATFIAWTGGITALMAALMAVQQNDIKKVLAYSTLSQLGYMVMAMGLSAPHEGMFHLYTHAFFKALLFLGAGAIIYACHHEQDMWKMGGLRKSMPLTFLTFAAGTAALMGVPLTSGFFSKEGILAAAYHSHNTLLFGMAVFTAALTAFYMTRMVIVVFMSKPRGEGAGHAHEAPLVMLLPLLVLAVPSLLSAYGFLAGPLQAMTPHVEHGAGHFVMICSIIALLTGLLTATKLYLGKDKDPLNIPVLANKFYIDEFYSLLVKVFVDIGAWIVTALEKIFVESLLVRLPAALAAGFGKWFRRLQTGSLQGYTFLLGLGLVVAVYIAVFMTVKH